MEVGQVAIIIVIVGFIILIKKIKGAQHDKAGKPVNVAKYIKCDKKTGEEYITCDILGKAVGVDAYGYTKKFTPREDFLGQFAGGALVGGAAGGALQARSIVGIATSSYKAGALGSGVAFGGFTFDKSVRTIEAGLEHLKQLAKNGELTASEFTKAAAALAFHDGEGKISGSRDKFGELIFKDDTDRAIAAMTAQFFYEYSMPLDKVYDFLADDNEAKRAPQ